MGTVFRSRERKRTTFTPFVDEYFLNAKGALEKKPIQRNQQDYIDSQVYTKLDDIYDYFSVIPQNNYSNLDDVVHDIIRYETDLDVLLEADKIIEEYRNEFKLGSEYSRSDIYGLIMSRAQQSRKNINNEESVNYEEKENKIEQKSE